MLTRRTAPLIALLSLIMTLMATLALACGPAAPRSQSAPPPVAAEPMIVASKGISSNGMAFKINDANARNPYVRQALRCADTLDRLHREHPSVYILGEIYGLQKGYRYDAGQDWPMRVFDIYLGEPNRGQYVGWDRMLDLLQDELPTVPLLYSKSCPAARPRSRRSTSGRAQSSKPIRPGTTCKPAVLSSRQSTRPTG